MAQNILNYVIRKLDCVNPVRLGKSVLLGASLPIASYYLLFLGVFALFLLGGVNTWPIVVRFAQDSTLVLSPIWAALLGGWMLYAYMYAAVLLIPLALALTFALIHKLRIVVQLLDDATSALLILRDRIVAVWAHLIGISPVYGITGTLTNSLQISLPTGPPDRPAAGWNPGTHPMLA